MSEHDEGNVVAVEVARTNQLPLKYVELRCQRARLQIRIHLARLLRFRELHRTSRASRRHDLARHGCAVSVENKCVNRITPSSHSQDLDRPPELIQDPYQTILPPFRAF